MKKYYPIFLSKAGELEALRNLDSNIKNEICPIIQVIPEKESKSTGKTKAPKEHVLIEKLSETWAFHNNAIFLDFSLLEPFNAVLVRNLIQRLTTRNVNITPVMQINSQTQYIHLLQSLFSTGEFDSLCFRLSLRSGGFLNINSRLQELNAAFKLPKNKIHLLLDIGYVQDNFSLLTHALTSIISSIPGIDKFASVIIASGSFPENLTALTAGKLHKLHRYEWHLWNSLIEDDGLSRIISFGDFGTKYPIYSDTSFRGTCSIKYSIEDDFVIYRGELSDNHRLGNGQYNMFAKKLVNSEDYSGSGFSWGDEKIDFYSQEDPENPKRKTGNATNWVEISQNHHITLLHSLI